MKQRAIILVASVAVLGLLILFGYLVWAGVTELATFLSAADPNVVAAVIGAAGTALASVLAVLVAQYFAKKKRNYRGSSQKKS